MPLPERYIKPVQDVHDLWTPEGYFYAQTDIWKAQCTARNRIEGAPTDEQLGQIQEALKLTPDDISYLNTADGHETNNLLRRVQERLPAEAGNFIHLGNTSKDVLDTSLAMQMAKSTDIITSDFWGLKTLLDEMAITYEDTLQVGRSHGQHAIPNTFGRKLVNWTDEVSRGITRLNFAREMVAVGKLSGEIGTNINISPEVEEESLRILGLTPDPAPTQVISRDRHATALVLMAVNAGSLERFAVNIRTMARTEIREVSEPFSGVGSSAMPHKKNPELSERITGFARHLRAVSLAEMESQALWDERDISHSSTERFEFPDAFEGLSYQTRLMTRVLKGLTVYPDRMAKNLEMTHGAIYSPGLLNTLIGKGYPRRQAYELVQGLAQTAMDGEINLRVLAGQNPDISAAITPGELDTLFDHQTYLKNIEVAYKRAGLLS